MEYTKGEWKSYHDSMTARDAVCAEDGVGFFSKEVCRVKGDSQGERFANCNLIAASPDMYEQLKAAVAILRYEKYQDTQPVLREMIKAIAKAEGK